MGYYDQVDYPYSENNRNTTYVPEMERGKNDKKEIQKGNSAGRASRTLTSVRKPNMYYCMYSIEHGVNPGYYYNYVVTGIACPRPFAYWNSLEFSC